MQGDLGGRVVVVTGGTGALGTAVVGWALAQGAEVHVPCFKARELEGYAHGADPRVRVVVGPDLTKEADVAAYYGGLPGLWASIHLAGGFAMAPLEATSLELWTRMWQLNAVSCFLCVREATRALRRSGGGRIVNVAARPALEPAGGMIAYATAKAAVAALTRSAAAELAQDGILVNAVLPSIMDTAANRAAMPEADWARWPKVEEVAAAIGFLASETNLLTTGALVPVYGRA